MKNDIINVWCGEHLSTFRFDFGKFRYKNIQNLNRTLFMNIIQAF